MLVVFPPIFVANAKLIYKLIYNFLAPLKYKKNCVIKTCFKRDLFIKKNIIYKEKILSSSFIKKNLERSQK